MTGRGEAKVLVTTDLDDQCIETFGLLLEAHVRLVAVLDAELEAGADLSLRWFEVLIRLGRTPGGCLTMGQLAEAVALSTGGATRLIDRIEHAGFIERRGRAEDRRVVDVCLTDAGRRRLDEALPVHLDGLRRHLADALGDVGLAQFTEALRAVRDH